MDIRAILIVAPQESSAIGNERFADVPLSLMDVVGAPVLLRSVERLRRSGIEAVTVICEDSSEAAKRARTLLRGKAEWFSDRRNPLRAAESAFSEMAQAGAEVVIVARLGAYAEIDYDGLIQFHLDHGARVTPVRDDEGPLEIFAISASRRNDAAYLFRHELTQFRVEPDWFETAGYVNRLRNSYDLRALGIDALQQKNLITPVGEQLKPGVWAGKGARIHKTARILAPAFIGEFARVHAGAVLTRGAIIEHHSAVDCGTVVDASTLLPFSCAGAGLDLTQSVVGFKLLHHLRRDAVVEIFDSKLIGMTPTSPSWRAIRETVALATVIPRTLLRPRAPVPDPAKAAMPGSTPALAPDLQAAQSGSASPQFTSNLAVMRRYGNE